MGDLDRQKYDNEPGHNDDRRLGISYQARSEKREQEYPGDHSDHSADDERRRRDLCDAGRYRKYLERHYRQDPSYEHAGHTVFFRECLGFVDMMRLYQNEPAILDYGRHGRVPSERIADSAADRSAERAEY